jgi:hypothetical protein
VFDIACVDPNGPLSLDKRVTLTPGALVATISPIPTGDICTVTEVDPGDGIPLGVTPATVTIPGYVAGEPPPGPVAVTAINDYPAGIAQVQKVLAGDASGPMAGATFGLGLECERELINGAGIQVLVDDVEPITIDGSVTSGIPLPVGSTCWASEPDGVGATSVEISDPQDDPAVIAGGTTTITVTNTYTAGGNADGDIDRSGIQVTKVLEGPGVPWARGPFTFGVTCTLAGFELPRYDLVLDPDTPVGYVNPVPVGAECTVTETGTGNADTPGPVVVGQVTVPAADAPPVEIVATNTFTGGSVVVAKEITGPVADQLGAARFTVAVRCEWDDPATGATVELVDTTVEVTPGSEAVAGRNLPVGTRCFAEEVDTGGAASSSVQPGGPNNPAVITQAGEAVVLVATNRFDAGTLVLAKELEGAGPTGAFDLEVACVLPTPAGTDVPLDLSGLPGAMALADGAVRIAVTPGTPVPLAVADGARCTVGEANRRGALATRIPGPLEVAGTVGATVVNVYPAGLLPRTGWGGFAPVMLAVGMIAAGAALTLGGRRWPMRR